MSPFWHAGRRMELLTAGLRRNVQADKGPSIRIDIEFSDVGVPTVFVLARAATYSALFVGLLLIFLPNRILSSTGIIQPAAIGAWQAAGMLLGASGAALALACIL